MDEAQKAWSAAWVAAWAEIPDVKKTKKANAGSYTYTYADLADVLATVRPVLKKHGLAVSQSVTGDEKGVAVETRVTHTEGWTERFGPLVLSSPGDPRSAGGAITYARRYGLSAALGIATEDDTDGATASKPAPKPKPAKAVTEPYPLHVKAWNHAKEIYGDGAKEPFVGALRFAGLPEGQRVETEAELMTVMKALDEAAPMEG